MSIIVQRKHVVAPADRAEYERMSSGGVWPTFLEFGSRMLAYGTWTFGGGPVDGVITNQAYADMEHWTATRAQFAGTPGAFYEDEAIMAATADSRAISADRNKMMLGTEARIIEVDDEVTDLGVYYRHPGTSPAEPPPTFGRGSIVSERTYQLAPGAEQEFAQISKQHIWPWLEAQGGHIIASGHDPLAASDEVITLFAFRSLSEWERLSRPSNEPAPAEVVQAWQDRARLITRHRGRLLLIGTDFGTPA
ncbi:MAG: hypothetical protein V3R95_04790 [Dehalococcoidia bacterium]